jgi:hypothetical protein
VSAAASVIYGVVNTLHNSFIRRVNFIKDYLTPLHVNTELKGAFYELVYAYKDSAFQEINSIQLTNDQARELRGKPSAFFKMNPGELNDPRNSESRQTVLSSLYNAR